MPELAEVESAREDLEKNCLNKKIISINTKEQGNGGRNGLFDHILYETVIPQDIMTYYLNMEAKKSEHAPLSHKIEKKTSSKKNGKKENSAEVENNLELIENIYQTLIKNKFISKVCRKGKQLWLELSDVDPASPAYVPAAPENQLAVLLHFGLTGYIVFNDHEVPSFKGYNKDTNWPPKFTKLHLALENPSGLSPIEFVLCDIRRLGQVALRLNPLGSSPIKELAFDPVNEELPQIPELTKLFHQYRLAIKPLLLTQDRIFCGIGNYLADEILYQSKIHPNTRANEINEFGVSKMVEKMKMILEIAIQCSGESEKFPKDWLFHYRWEKGSSQPQQRLPNGNPVTYDTIGGRTTAIVVKEQPKNGYYRLHSSSSEDEGLEEDSSSLTEHSEKNVQGKKLRKESSQVKEGELSQRKKTARKQEDGSSNQQQQIPTGRGRKRKSEDADAPHDTKPPKASRKALQNVETPKSELGVRRSSRIKK